jgi:RecA/RadA recombinase
MAKKVKKTKKKKTTRKSKKDKPWIYENVCINLTEEAEKKYGEGPLGLFEDVASSRISTGSLSLDLILGGGIPVGRWITIYGPEASGKSTLTYLMVKAAIDLKIPNKLFFDYETSLATSYFANIVGMPLKKVLGNKDEDGKWLKRPIVRHYMPDTGEKFFKMMSRIMGKLPDVVMVKNKRYLRFTEKQIKDLKVPEEKIDFSHDKGFYARDSGPPIKLIAFLDSFPEMLPEALLDDPDKSPMAKQARMFSEGITLLRTRLKRKGGVLVGVNHIRMRPMTMYGSPEYEPCGEHLKLATDIRIRASACAIPHGKGRIEDEPSLDGKLERFCYSKIATKKNKTFPKDKDVILRFCLEVEGKSGYGVCPVWDLFQYLQKTKQIKKRGAKITIEMPGPWEDVAMTWEDLKLLVYRPLDKSLLALLAVESEELQKVLKSKKGKKAKVKSIQKLLSIKEACQKQITTGEAFELAAGS